MTAAVAFAIVLILTLVLVQEAPERQWYEGRAAAESVKSLAWRFATGSARYPLHDEQSTERFLEDVDFVIDAFATVAWPAPTSDRQVTETMASLRDETLARRRDAYVHGRVDDQVRWYTTRSEKNHRQALRANLVVASVTAVGLWFAFLQGFGLLSVNVLGVTSVIAAAVTAWSGLRQYRILTVAYARTAQQLLRAKEDLLSADDEPTWAIAVEDTEKTISKEHALWLARTGSHSSLRSKAIKPPSGRSEPRPG